MSNGKINTQSADSHNAYIVASELKDPIWHSLECQIGSFSSEATTRTGDVQMLFICWYHAISQWTISYGN